MRKKASKSFQKLRKASKGALRGQKSLLDERVGRLQLLAMLIGAKRPEAVLNCGSEDFEDFNVM